MGTEPNTPEATLRSLTVQHAQQYLALLQAHDWDAWSRLWAEDAILEFPYAPDDRPNRYEGREAILRYMSATTESIAVDSVTELTIHEQLAPEELVVELAIDGRLLHNGARYQQRYVTFFKFENGLIRHYREYWNPLITIEAFGGYEAWRKGAARWSSASTQG